MNYPPQQARNSTTSWPKRPIIYEINTWVWLYELSQRYGKAITLGAVPLHGFREGEWRLCEQSGWPDNARYLNLLAWCCRAGDDRYLIVVNLSATRSQGRTRVPWSDLAEKSWRLADLFTGEVYERNGNEMRDPGLYVELAPWGFHCLRF